MPCPISTIGRASGIEPLRLPEASGGDGELVYTLRPDVTEIGLSFDPATRVVSGTPSRAQDWTEYTLTATDEDGDTAELSFWVEVRPDLKPSFGGAVVEDQRYKEGREIPALTLPAATGGDGVLVYSLTPDVGGIGLVFDAGSRVLSGTPSRAQDWTQYTLTATDEDGDTAALSFRVEVRPDLKSEFR